MSDEKSIRLRIVTAEGYDDTADMLRSIAAGEMPEGAVCIYPGTRNQLYTLPSPHGVLVVKCFRTPNAVNSIAYTTVRTSKACRSFLNSIRLQRLGISVPEPIAYAEERKGLRMRRSYYLSRAVEGDTIRFYEMRPDCDEMLRGLAREMLRMHLMGVWHKDFSPGNVIVKRDTDGRHSFNYVDLNRMAFNTVDHDKQLHMFERINYTELHTARLAHAYASLFPTREPFATDFRRILDPGKEEDPLQGLYPLLHTDALIRRGKRFIVEGAIKAFRRFWHSRNSKKRFLKRLHLHR